VDETAKQLAISEGLPEEKVFVRGNPYHYYLKNYWWSQFSNKNYLEKLHISQTGFHILFAPDPLSIRNGKEIAGFDEMEALEDLLFIISQLNNGIRLIVKCHPLQPVHELLELIERNNNPNCFLIREADTLELICASDIVVGFYSNILLEAESLNKKVIRYFPGNPEADLLKHKISLKKVQSKNELMEEIKHSIYERNNLS
jgi:CDP-glycerol glycerophosphotransferase (TagB/SpsB family)